MGAPEDSTSRDDKKTFERWQRAFSSFTGLGLTLDEAEKRRADKDAKFLHTQRQTCLFWRNDLLKSSPAVTFMAQHLGQHGVRVNSTNIICEPCDMTRSGGFSPELREVLLCQNGFSSKQHMEDTIVHELIHLYDHTKFKVDWSDLRHVACSETSELSKKIRSANLSGDCKWDREVFRRGVLGFTKHHQTCVRRRAVLSVSQHPNCSNMEDAERAVNEAWESCIGDTRPFDEIY